MLAFAKERFGRPWQRFETHPFMAHLSRDTIFAVATGIGRAAVAVIRLSGPAAGTVMASMAGPLPAARRATLRRLRDPIGGHDLDRALVLWFPAPASFTGEPCAELHLHGGRAVIAATLAALASQPGCRLAQPGEFTRRAFLNGKMDLAEVEGLADLIEAQTEAQRRQALRQLDGALGAWTTEQRELLLHALAAIESAIDFADEDDAIGDPMGEVREIVGKLLVAVSRELGRSVAAERIRDGLVVVLTGPPNVGKSTLLNALARRDVAIVSPHPGTTRDAVAVDLDLEGCLVHLVDTAGLRETEDDIEREGIARALERARKADLVLWLTDARNPCAPDPALGECPVWTVVTKVDLARLRPEGLSVSAPSGIGLANLVEAIRSFAASESSGAEDAVTSRLRHRRALEEAAAGLAAVYEGRAYPELIAVELRRVAERLEALVGRIEPDEVLGAIFARFCIGK